MFEPNWQRAGFKTRNDAVIAILESISQTPGCAGKDGTLGIMLYNTFITIRPKKKKQSQTYETEPTESSAL